MGLFGPLLCPAHGGTSTSRSCQVCYDQLTMQEEMLSRVHGQKKVCGICGRSLGECECREKHNALIASVRKWIPEVDALDARNSQLQDEVRRLREANRELTGQVENLTAQNEELTIECDGLNVKCAKLEDNNQYLFGALDREIESVKFYRLKYEAEKLPIPALSSRPEEVNYYQNGQIVSWPGCMVLVEDEVNYGNIFDWIDRVTAEAIDASELDVIYSAIVAHLKLNPADVYYAQALRRVQVLLELPVELPEGVTEPPK